MDWCWKNVENLPEFRLILEKNMECFGFLLIEFVYYLNIDIESDCSDK